MFFFLCLQQEQRLGETGGALAEVKFEKHVTKHIALDLQKLEKWWQSQDPSTESPERAQPNFWGITVWPTVTGIASRENLQKNSCLILQNRVACYFPVQLVGGLEHFLFSISYMGCHPSQLTFIFFKMVIAPPTRQFLSYPPYKIYKSSNVATWRLGAGKIIKGWVKQP